MDGIPSATSVCLYLQPFIDEIPQALSLSFRNDMTSDCFRYHARPSRLKTFAGSNEPRSGWPYLLLPPLLRNMSSGSTSAQPLSHSASTFHIYNQASPIPVPWESLQGQAVWDFGELTLVALMECLKLPGKLFRRSLSL